MIRINLFDIISQDFFKPLTSKHKKLYIDCITIIYNIYKNELSFGVDKAIIVSELEIYFENQSNEEIIFDDDEIAKDSRTKANKILRSLKESGWIEYEATDNFNIKVNLHDYAATIVEAFNKVIKNEEMEYQSLVSQIHATLLNKEGYQKPYEYIIKRTIENTEELIIGLKKLNTNIKKYIDAITNDKSAGEIVEDFFIYHKDIGSKAYHRIKTSDNISYFRASIIEKLYIIIDDKEIFERAKKGYMEIEKVEDEYEALEELRRKILNVINSFRDYDEIINEIDRKNSKYISNAISRAKFLLSSTNNIEGKISNILAYMSKELNNNEELDLDEDLDNDLIKVFNIFPQLFIDNDSLYVVPISKKVSLPEELSTTIGMSEEEREKRKQLIREKNKIRFSRKNIYNYVEEILKDKDAVLASTLPLESKRDLIRIIFIKLYSSDKKANYKTVDNNKVIEINDFRFSDFTIEREN